jgi:hypothetical protein
MTNINKHDPQPGSPAATWLKTERDIFTRHLEQAAMSGNFFAPFTFSFIWAVLKSVGQAHAAHVANYGSLKAAHATGHEVAHSAAANRPSTPATKPSLARSSLG